MSRGLVRVTAKLELYILKYMMIFLWFLWFLLSLYDLLVSEKQ